MAWNKLIKDPLFAMLRSHLLEVAPEVCWRNILFNALKEDIDDDFFLNIIIAAVLMPNSNFTLGPEFEPLVGHLKNVNNLRYVASRLSDEIANSSPGSKGDETETQSWGEYLLYKAQTQAIYKACLTSSSPRP